MIKNINICKCATYNDIGASINDCKKVNFIYGANGSGKTTISNFLQSSSEEKYNNCSIEWENATREKVIVYNRKFKDLNFRQTEIPGVFTMGHATIEQQQELEKKKEEQEEYRAEKIKEEESLTKIKSRKEEITDKFKNDLWKIVFLKYDKSFSEAFTGTRNSKERFYKESTRRYSIFKPNEYKEDLLQEKASKLFGTRPSACSEIDFSIENLMEEINLIESNPIWETAIIGREDVPIAKLIRKMNSDDWINNGIKYLTKDSDLCPFCQQHTITQDFRKQLDDFFDESYEEELSKLKNLLNKYTELTNAIINSVSTEGFDEESINIGHLNIDSINAERRIIKEIFERNLKSIEEKKNEPTKKISLDSIKSSCRTIIACIDSANIAIRQHNQLVSDYEKEKEQLICDIWDYIIQENKSLFEDYYKKIKNIEKGISGISTKINNLKLIISSTEKDIVEKGKSVTSVQPAVDEINRLLKAYGFTSFSIAASSTKENSYQIERADGSLATNTLSEGEETFISFLYFMQMQKGSINQEEVSNKKIIVLDDPISSLDSTILYIVSAMTKELIRKVLDGTSDVSQIFVFTHNVFFHKEASFINGRPNNQNKEINYWIVSKDRNISSITAYQMENPIRTSYELLWKELRDSTTSSLVTIQNTMRRIIENYFGMLGKNRDTYIEEQFDSTEEQLICRSLFYWINDGSHTITDDLFIDPYTDSIEKYKEVFRLIFYKTGHETHYNMMMDKLNN